MGTNMFKVQSGHLSASVGASVRLCGEKANSVVGNLWVLQHVLYTAVSNSISN